MKKIEDGSDDWKKVESPREDRVKARKGSKGAERARSLALSVVRDPFAAAPCTSKGARGIPAALRVYAAQLARLHSTGIVRVAVRIIHLSAVLISPHPTRTQEASCRISELPCNTKKNRFKNIKPYDHSRIKLCAFTLSSPNLAVEEDDFSYINASWIEPDSALGTHGCRYIAAQGPCKKTMSDFWRCVWETHVSVIGILTQLVENGQAKCHCYYPDPENGVLVVKHGAFTITHVRTTYHGKSIVREFILLFENSGEQRNVKQVAFMDWPDHGVPRNSGSFLSYRLLIKKIHLEMQHGPLLLHCSAGVGRTGVFIAIDILLSNVQCGPDVGLAINVDETVKRLRRARCSMVQTAEQYKFIYTAVRDALLYHYF